MTDWIVGRGGKGAVRGGMSDVSKQGGGFAPTGAGEGGREGRREGIVCSENRQERGDWLEEW